MDIKSPNQAEAFFGIDDGEDSEKIFFEPEGYYRNLLDDINQAQHEIILETYSFKLDEIGLQFVTALTRATRRGVRTRMLVDGVGSYNDSGKIALLLESENFELHIFHPLPWDFAAYRRALNAGRWYSQILHFIASVNHRDHRKLCIVDNRIAWLGSFNITADHFNKRLRSKDDNWHDTGLRVTGAIVSDLKNNFADVWAHKIAPLKQRSQKFLSNNSIQARASRNRRLIRILTQARHRIWITNAYFNPSFKLLRALKKSARQGVDVRILVPSLSDVFLFPLIARTYYADLLNAGIRIFEYRLRLLHSKTMIIDNQVLIGSTNLNYRSFLHDLELDALLYSQESLSSMHDKFNQDIQNSAEIDLHTWGKHRWLMGILGWLSRFFRYWL